MTIGVVVVRGIGLASASTKPLTLMWNESMILAVQIRECSLNAVEFRLVSIRVSFGLVSSLRFDYSAVYSSTIGSRRFVRLVGL